MQICQIVHALQFKKKNVFSLLYKSGGKQFRMLSKHYFYLGKPLKI